MSHATAQPARPPALIRENYQQIRKETETLCRPLKAEDYVVQSMPDASPAKWHLAHTTWFFETFLLKAYEQNYQEYDPAYNFLFNSYYYRVAPMHARAQRGMLTRPDIEEIYRYRDEIDSRIAAFSEYWAQRKEWEEIVAVLELGLQHEQQHQELILTDLKHLFWQNPLRPAYGAVRENRAEESLPEPEWLFLDEGTRSIGHDGTGFAFDNEKPLHTQYLQAFEISSHLVTNRQYLAFIEDGGYHRPELWLSEGWQAVSENRWQAPFYWQKDNGKWFQFTLAGMQPLENGAPVCHLSYYEADAYARWAAARLPREAEWEAAAKEYALSQAFGRVWQWTQSAYAPYPGFRENPLAIGEYNAKFMCGQYVLRGSSCATAESHARPAYRNFFYPGQRWQFTGLRLARDVAA